jgi:hypothetical protein
MRPISVHVDGEDYRHLKALADRSGRPVAELIREAMAEYIAHREGEALCSTSSLIRAEPFSAPGTARRCSTKCSTRDHRDRLGMFLSLGRQIPAPSPITASRLRQRVT